VGLTTLHHKNKLVMKNLTHSLNKLKKFEQTSAFQIADGNCFLEQERRAGGGMYETRYHNNIINVDIWVLVVLLHDSAHPSTAAHT
jgi:hypothetical protein